MPSAVRLRRLGSMQTSTKHTIATLLLCAAIVVATVIALMAMTPPA